MRRREASVGTLAAWEGGVGIQGVGLVDGAYAARGVKGWPWKEVEVGRQSVTALATKAGAWHETKTRRRRGRHARSALSTSAWSPARGGSTMATRESRSYAVASRAPEGVG